MIVKSNFMRLSPKLCLIIPDYKVHKGKKESQIEITAGLNLKLEVTFECIIQHQKQNNIFRNINSINIYISHM